MVSPLIGNAALLVSRRKKRDEGGGESAQEIAEVWIDWLRQNRLCVVENMLWDPCGRAGRSWNELE